MRRGLAVVVSVCALALAASASASAPTAYAWDIGLFSITPGSTETEGIVRDAPLYGGITSAGPFCCEITVSFERTFNADVLRGSVSGTFGVGGNAEETVWRGELHGRMTPTGSNGALTAYEQRFSGGELVRTGRRFVGTWSSPGQWDQSVFHWITLDIEGMLLGS